MYLLKDVFNLKNTKTANIVKIEDQAQADEENASGTNLHEHVDIVEDIRNQINEIEEEESSRNSDNLFADGQSMSLKDTILKKVGQFKRKTKQLILPGKLAMSMLQAKNMMGL